MCEYWSMFFGCCCKAAREEGRDCDECPYYTEVYKRWDVNEKDLCGSR